ncbi:MAG TPA: carboxypeptidase regulatory-like domain-containing protein [Bryobacteraceae bacterium]|nr:carboxypeptidase regulatory-like domain-containing protein [Bryobacteraceae bacterium]
MLRFVSRVAICVVALLLASTSLRLSGQMLVGRISGTITDPTGAPVAGARVTVVNVDTQATRIAMTDSKGFYSVEELPIGPYRIQVDRAGFKRATQSGLSLTSDARVTASFMLQVGELSQTISVEAHPEQLNTVSGEIAHVVDQRQVSNLPLNGRSYMELLTLVPGVTVTNPDQFSVNTSLSATNQVVNGHRGNQNNITVDGVGNLDNGSNGSLINNISPDFMQEVKIQTSNFSAEYGRSTGAAFNLATKNGTNQFHGAAFEYFRNDVLDARNVFSPSKTELRFNDFGYDLGGPIRKNKLFFFIGEEWKRIRQQAAPMRETLPTLAELNGNFAGTSAKLNSNYPGNIIPPSEITPDGKAIANVYRTVIPLAASYKNQAVSNNTIFQTPNPLDYREDLARIDYHIGDKHTLYGRWVDDYNSIFLNFGPGGSIPITPEIRDRPGKSALLNESWIVSPSVVNEAHLGASWNGQRYYNQGDTWLRSTQGFTFQRVFNSIGQYPNGIPDVSIASFAGWDGPDHTLISPTAEIEGGDTVSMVYRQHTIRTGVMIIRNRKNQNGRSPYDGSLTFNSTGNPNTTGYSLADALTGNFNTYTEAQYDPIGYYRYTEPSAFVDDTWKITRKLSINLGLRYEYFMTMYSQINNLTNFVPSLYDPSQAVKITSSGQIVPGSGNIYNGLLRVANGITPGYGYLVPNADSPAVLEVPDGGPRGMYPSHGTWSPRVGFAYELNGKTVIRGGFGLFYDRIQGNPTFYTLNNPPYVSSVAYNYGNLSSITGGTAASAPFGTLQVVQPNLQVPYSEQFSVSIQRELPARLFLETDYLGTLGRHLLVEPDMNQPTFAALGAASSTTNINALRYYAGYSVIQQFMSAATSNYHALQVQLSRRAGDVTFTAAYTFSKVLGNASSDTENDKDYYNLYWMYGPLSYDATHVFTGSFVWNLPRLRNSPALVRAPFGNWQFAGIIHLQSGFADKIVGNTTVLTGSREADYLGGPALLPNPGPDGWFNKTAFAPAPQGRFGTSGNGNVRDPGLQQYNLSVARFFNLTERMNLQFRADFINALNHPNYEAPGNNVSDSTFGTVSSAYPPRNIQFSIKVQF